MCGLFGWQLKEAALEEGNLYTLAAVLAHFAERRGDDSWGAALVDGSNTPSIIKNIGSIRNTCSTKTILAPQVIGHTRKATKGAVTVENAHPFRIGNTIGAHNGFVFDHDGMNKKYNRDYNVDSQHLIAHIDEARDLTELDGSGTVTYMEVDKPGTVYMGRGAGSDLVVMGIGAVGAPRGVVWASVQSWLDDALSIAGFKQTFVYDTATYKRYYTKGGKLFTDGEFPFGSKVRQYSGNVHYPHRQRYGRYEYYDVPAGNDYWNNKNQCDARRGIVEITQQDLDQLPAALKKTSQVGDVEKGQTQEARGQTEQCDGCLTWGARVDDYEINPRGIVYHPSVDEQLCFKCAAWWGTETGKAVVPSLRLMLPGQTIQE